MNNSLPRCSSVFLLFSQHQATNGKTHVGIVFFGTMLAVIVQNLPVLPDVLTMNVQTNVKVIFQYNTCKTDKMYGGESNWYVVGRSFCASANDRGCLPAGASYVQRCA